MSNIDLATVIQRLTAYHDSQDIFKSIPYHARNRYHMQEELDAAITAIRDLGNGEAIWLTSITTEEQILGERMFLPSNTNCSQIKVAEIAQEQGNKNVKRVKDIVRSKQTPTLR